MPESIKLEQKEEKKATKVAKPKGVFSDAYKKLSAEIPKEHYIEMVRDDVVLTGYPGQIVIDRLNEIIGMENWYTEETILYQELVGGAWAVAMKVKLVISEPHTQDVVIRHGYGAQYARRIEDAFGGAFTNALKRTARQLGIGKELYYIKDEDQVAENKAAEEATPDIPEEAEALEDKIKKAENLEQLMSLETKVKSIGGPAVQKVLINKFNKRKLELSK